MQNWLSAHGVDIAVAVIALVSLILSIRAQQRVSRFDSFSYPGVILRPINVEDVDAYSFARYQNHKFEIAFAPGNTDFTITDVRLTRWDNYWNKYKVHFKNTDEQNGILYIEILNSKAALPTYLRVRVERVGSAQLSHWQIVRIPPDNIIDRMLGADSLVKNASAEAVRQGSL